MTGPWAQLLQTRAPRATVLIRIVVGGVLASEGIQKFLFPAELAAGRFAKIGIPAPELMGPFVGGVEIVCGLLLLAGLLGLGRGPARRHIDPGSAQRAVLVAYARNT